MPRNIRVNDTEISLLKINEKDYMSLTDMLKAKDGDFFISDWLRNRNTVEFLGIWEQIYNPDFNYGGFAIIKSQAGLNSYKLSVKEWVDKTNAIGIRATAGRYGGTYAYKDIAFEFGMWISPQFKIYLIKEFDRLKEEEQRRLGWDIKRNLTKINYLIHTDTIKENLIPPEVTAAQKDLIYTSEKEDIYQYALLLDGEWRSGKSYFVKNSLKNEIEKVERRAIYISLYGISSLGMLQTTVMNAYWADVSPKFEKILEITTALSPVLDIVPYVGSPAKEITRNFFSWKRKNY